LRSVVADATGGRVEYLAFDARDSRGRGLIGRLGLRKGAKRLSVFGTAARASPLALNASKRC
jgi:hypothetical protein